MALIEEGLKLCPFPSPELQKERKLLDYCSSRCHERFHRYPFRSSRHFLVHTLTLELGYIASKTNTSAKVHESSRQWLP
jgi:hypothetical protein